MNEITKIDPNVSMSTVTTVEITLGAWGYRSKHLVEVRGNMLGYSAIKAAIYDLEENIERSRSKINGYIGQECIYLYDGDKRLEWGFDDGARFEDLIVSAAIVKQESGD